MLDCNINQIETKGYIEDLIKEIETPFVHEFDRCRLIKEIKEKERKIVKFWKIVSSLERRVDKRGGVLESLKGKIDSGFAASINEALNYGGSEEEKAEKKPECRVCSRNLRRHGEGGCLRAYVKGGPESCSDFERSVYAGTVVESPDAMLRRLGVIK